MWETPEGDSDKRLFCEDDILAAPPPSDQVPEENLEDDELFGDLSDDEDADWKDGDFEEEWGLQPGEIDAEDDGWDSDQWLEENSWRKQHGEDAKTWRVEAARRAREAEEAAEAARRAAEEAAQAAEDGAVKKPAPKRDRRKRKTAYLDLTYHAPGFEVKAASKFRPEDHMAQNRKKKKAHGEGDGDGDGGEGKDGEDGDDAKYGKGFKEWSIYEDGRFVDGDFPPCQRSLGADIQEVDKWMRLSELTDKPCLFHRILPDACFRQAFLGNVWFTSACAAAAEYPAWIQSIFGRKRELSQSGRYKVRLYHPGQKCFKHIVVDDYVPVNDDSPYFAGVTSDGEIWVPLVEKAFAKMCGSYAATEWGLNAHAMHYVCGGPCTGSWARLGSSRWRRSCTVWNGNESNIVDRGPGEGMQEVGDWRDEDEVWAMLMLAMERCYPTACGLDKSQKSGLLSDRDYSVICAREVPTEDGWTLRMVLLRNVYELGRWNGRWSHGSDCWEKNPAVRAALEYEDRDDGTFWMSFSDFEQYFELIDFVRKSMPVQGCNKHKVREIKRGLSKHGTKKK